MISRVINGLLAVAFLIAGYLIIAGYVKPDLRAAEFVACIAMSNGLMTKANAKVGDES